MKKLTILIGLMILVSTSLASAELIITPNPIQVTARGGEQQTFQLTLQNTFNFKILDFEFTNLEGFTFPAIELNPNETKTIDFTVLRNQPETRAIESQVSFKYLVDIPEGVQTHNINITPDGFIPNFLVVRRGDTVRWTNVDDITRSVTGTGFDFDIQANQSNQFIFNQVGTYSYTDTILFQGGDIQVINESSSQRVNNPDYNKVLNVNLDITLDPTVLQINIEQLNFTVQATGSFESLLQLRNIGNETAQRVRLSSSPSWIRFDEDNFDLEANQNNLITFRIEPLILETDETNKNYTIEIKVKGANTEEYKRNITVFIPFSEILGDINTPEGFVAFFDRYCNSNPNTIICNNTLANSGEREVIIRDPELNINVSEREFVNTLREIQRIKDALSRVTNDQKQTNDLIISQYPEIFGLLNETRMKQDEVENISDARTRAFWIGFFCFILIGVIVATGLYVRKYLTKRNMMDGGYGFKY